MQTIPSGNRYVIAEYDIIGIWNYAIKLPCGGKLLLLFLYSLTMRRNYLYSIGITWLFIMTCYLKKGRVEILLNWKLVLYGIKHNGLICFDNPLEVDGQVVYFVKITP